MDLLPSLLQVGNLVSWPGMVEIVEGSDVVDDDLICRVDVLVLHQVCLRCGAPIVWPMQFSELYDIVVPGPELPNPRGQRAGFHPCVTGVAPEFEFPLMGFGKTLLHDWNSPSACGLVIYSKIPHH